MYLDEKPAESATPPSKSDGPIDLEINFDDPIPVPPVPQSNSVARPSNTSGGNYYQKNVVKNIDKTVRHIAEIRIFYDDQTWETFVPKK